MNNNNSSQEYLPLFFRDKYNQGNLMRYYAGYYGHGEAEENALITSVHLSVLQEYAFDIVLGYLANKNFYIRKSKLAINFPDLEILIEKYNNNETSLETNIDQSKEDETTINEYKLSYSWLPEEIRTFDKFKRIFTREIPENESLYKKHKEVLKEIDGRSGCIFFIDYFMWMLANFGYELVHSETEKEL